MTRPYIANNTLCVNGQPLRGDSLLAFRGNWGVRIIDRDFGDDHAGWTRGECRNVAYYRTLRDKFGLNCVRMFCYRDIRKAYPDNWFPWAELIPVIDAAVTITESLGMTLIIDHHPTPCGRRNWSLLDPAGGRADAWLPPGLTSFGQDCRDFWRYVAPRYATVEHVVYEVMNEPYAWSTTYLANYYADTAAIKFQGDLYTLIRGLAPEMPIICWSFAQSRGYIAGPNNEQTGRDLLDVVSQDTAINYENALVGFHGYAENKPSVERLRASKPVLMTEYVDASTVIPNWNNFEKHIGYWEEQGIGWIALNLAWTSRQPQMLGQVLRTPWKDAKPPLPTRWLGGLRPGVREGLRVGVR